MAQSDVHGWVAAGDVAQVREHVAAHGVEGWMLRAAASQCDIDMCTLLLQEGADVNAVDERGQTALHAVCMTAVGGDAAKVPLAKRVVSLLLNKGADAGREDAEGKTAPEIAKPNNEIKWVFKMASMMGGAAPAPAVRAPAVQTPDSTKRALFQAQVSVGEAESPRVASISRLPAAEAGRAAQKPQAPTPGASPRAEVSPRASGGHSPPAALASDIDGGHVDPDAPTESTYDYLNRVLFPVLNPALNEIATTRPADPVAHLISILSVTQRRGVSVAPAPMAAAAPQAQPVSMPVAAHSNGGGSSYSTPVYNRTRTSAVRSYTTGNMGSMSRDRSATPRSAGGLSAMRNRR